MLAASNFLRIENTVRRKLQRVTFLIIQPVLWRIVVWI